MNQNSDKKRIAKGAGYGFNVNLFLITLGVVALSAPAVYFWHAWSLSSMAGKIFDEAERLIQKVESSEDPETSPENQKELRHAANRLWQYQQIVPDDSAAVVLLAKTFERIAQGKANSRRAIELYLDAIARSGDDETDKNEMRVRVSDLLLEVFDFAKAEEVLRKTGAALTEDADCAKLFALSLWGKANTTKSSGDEKGELGTALKIAIELNPENTELPPILAAVYRDRDFRVHLDEAQKQELETLALTHDDRADQIVEAMVTRCNDAPKALLSRYYYKSKFGIPGAEADLNEAARKGSGDYEIMFQHGMYYLSRYQSSRLSADETARLSADENNPDLTVAKDSFEKCVGIAPEKLDAFIRLGDVLNAMGQTSEAVAKWTSVLEKLNESEVDPMSLAMLRHRLVGSMLKLDDQDGAETQLDLLDSLIKQISERADDPRQLFELRQSRQFVSAALAYKRGEIASAITTLEAAILDEGRQANPRIFDLYRLLGAIFTELDLPSRAANTYAKAVDLDGSQLEFRLKLSQARARAGQFDAAVDAFEPIVEKNNASIEDWVQYTSLLFQQQANRNPAGRDWQRFDGALQQARKLFAADPENELARPWRLDLFELQRASASITPVVPGEGNPGEGNTGEGEGNTGDTPPTAPVDARVVERLSLLESQIDEDSRDLSKSLALMYMLAGQDKDSQRLLEKYNELAGETSERYIFSAGLFARKSDFDEASKILAEGLAAVPEDQKHAIRMAQVSLLLNQGKLDPAIEELEKLANENMDLPDLVIKLADLITQSPGLVKMEPAKWEQRLRKIEGDDGPYSTCLKVFRKLLEVKELTDWDSQDKKLREAKELCGRIVRLRSDWATGHTLTAMVIQARFNAALKTRKLDPSELASMQAEEMRALYRALDLGESKVWVIHRLGRLELDLGNEVAMQNLLSRVDSNVIANDSVLTSFQTSMRIANNEMENAFREAKRGTDLRPGEPAAWLNRAWTELLSGDKTGTRESLKKAVELASDQDNAVLILREVFKIYVNADLRSKGEDEWVESARQLIPMICELIPDAEKQIVEAELSASLRGHDPVAVFESYENAVKAAPNDRNVLEGALRYFALTRTSPKGLDEAIRIAEKLSEIVTDKAELAVLRRNWANLLARRGTSEDWELIPEVLEGIDPRLNESNENNRVMAVLLITKRDVPNQERRVNLEKALSYVKGKEAATDLIVAGQVLRMLAELPSSVNDEKSREEKLDEAELLLDRAANAPDVNLGQLYSIIEYYLEKKDWDKANRSIVKLQRLVAQERSVLRQERYVSLAARLMLLRGQTEKSKIVAFVEDFGNKVEKETRKYTNSTRAVELQKVAAILESVDAKEEAVVWRQKAIQQDPRQRLGLAFEIAENGDKDEAINQCTIGYEETGRPEFVLAVSRFMTTGETTPEQSKAADKLFDSALRNAPKDFNLLMSIGNFRFATQHRIDDAIQLYKKALELSPDNQVLLNNLASAYTEMPGELEQALRTVNRAIQVHGQRPGLMDTKAVILMLKGDLDAAASLLKDIVNQSSDARYWWHLSEVRWKQFEETKKEQYRVEAKSAFATSEELGLASQIFTPGEKVRLAELRKKFNHREGEVPADPQTLNHHREGEAPAAPLTWELPPIPSRVAGETA